MTKHIIFIIILTISVSVIPISANAATLYVDVNGADTNTGSSGSPFRTIQKGVDTAVPGDTVHVRAGTYYEQVAPTSSGSADNVITIEGETGTIVDGTSYEYTSGWSSAGNGKYSRTIGYTVGSVYEEDGSDIYFMPMCKNNCISGSTYYTNYPALNVPAAATASPSNYSGSVTWWDAFYGISYQSGSTLYVRFKDSEDPNSKTIRVSSGLTGSGIAVFDFTNDSYITLDNLEIRGSQRGVEISGSSHHITVQNCDIYSAQRKIYFDNNTGGECTIANNNIYQSDGADYTFGGFSYNGGGSTYALGMYQLKYEEYKRPFSNPSGNDSSQESGGINFIKCAGTNYIYGNTITGNSMGIGTLNSGLLHIYENRIVGSQQAVNLNLIDDNQSSSNKTSVDMHDNEIVTTNYGVRFGRTNLYGGQVTSHIYNNKFYESEPGGIVLYFDIRGTSVCNPTYPPKIYFYHNSANGFANFTRGTYSCTSGTVISNFGFVDNVINTRGDVGYTTYSIDFSAYNWARFSFGSWNTSNNLTGSQIWSYASEPDFVLPAGSPARESGIDLSANFTINQQTYQQLSGMEPNYYANGAPDMGTFDAEPAPPLEPQPLQPPSNLRIASN